MKKLILMYFAGVTLLGCGNKNEPLIQGKTEQEELAVTGKITGRMDTLFVAEGDFVKKGDTLAILSIPEIDAKKAQAAGAVESAEAQYQMSVTGATANQLTQLQAKKEALQEQYIFAEKSLGRLKNMVMDSLIPQQTYDEAYAKFQGAKAQLAAVKAEILDVQHGVRPEQQQMALGQKNRALGAMLEATTAENERYIVAPADMTVDLITLKVGELALPGYTLFKGYLPASTSFRFTIPENDLKKVQKGMAVTVKIVYNNQEIPGTISHVKQLPAYANIATAYPDYEMQQALFEITVSPTNQELVKDLFSNTNVILKL